MIPAPELTASQLRPHIERCGYRRRFIQPDVEYDVGARVSLAAFAHPPFDARSACIVAIDGPSQREAVGACRSTGAPIVFTCHEGQVQWWKVGPSDVRPIGPPVGAEETSAFFELHSADFSPQRVYRAKTWARLDKQLELPFVDVDLLPVVERDMGTALAQLIEVEYAELQDHLGWKETTASQAKWMLQSIFWLVSAKLLHDKGVPSFSDVDLQDVRAVFDRIARHHGKSAFRLDSHGETKLRRIAQDISRFSNLTFATSEALAFIYENAMITDEIRDELGTHRTPAYLVDYIVGRLAPWIEQIDERKRNVFEPACGHAGFLGAAIRLLTELLPDDKSTASNRRKYLRRRVHGCEIDPFALEIARLSLTLADIPNPDHWDLDSGDMFETKILEQQAKTATILLANPPFRDFTDDERERYRSAGFECRYKNKTAEMLRRTLPHLPESACFGVVVPQGFLHSRNSAELRRETLCRYEIDEILLFPDKVFKFSDMESAILIGRRDNVGRLHQIRYGRVRERDVDGFKDTYAVSTQRDAPQIRFQTAECDLRLPELEHLWVSLEELPFQLCDIADVGRGFSKSAKLKNKEFYFDNRAKGRSPVFHRFPKGIELHSLPRHKWADLSKDNLDRVRRGRPYDTGQVIFNYYPTSRGPWRLKALVDQDGHGVSSSFVVVRPEKSDLPLEYLWALLNSPVANAFAYSHLGKRHIMERTIRELRVPVATPLQISSIEELVKQYLSLAETREGPLFRRDGFPSPKEILLRIDAAVLEIYKLTREAERELLDLFAGFKRWGVPFKFEGYLPGHLKQPVHLHEIITVTYDWLNTNQRRGQLIEHEVQGKLSAKESKELAQLQRLADLRTDLLDPFNLEELEKLHAELTVSNG